jgi:uncharacterized protein DUF5916/cellulose/xylan binding protein with CBM9 domain
MKKFIVVPFLLSAASLHAQTTTVASNKEVPVASDTPAISSRAVATERVAMSTKVTAPPVLDGKTDDPAWKSAQVIDKFLEYDPKVGAVPRFKTELRVVNDDKYLYVLARMYDPAPDSMISLLSRRDVRTQSEQLKLMIDSYHDRRTGYEFCVNPAGVKRDFYVSDDNNEDPSWDGVWDVATRMDSVGWVAEFRIPFSQLRFPNAEEHTFGFMVVRDIGRTAQRISWPLYHRDQQGYISQTGELSGITGIGQPSRLEVAPYVVTKNETRPSGSSWKHPQAFAAGADLKYGLSSNLTVNATINPDFGQVEADPAVLNLSAFEQFFEERRPFFLEGSGIFSFRTSCGDIDTQCTGLFYSRRIGRSPQLGGLYGDETSAQNTTILGAAKVTGRIAKGMSVGLLDAVTQREVGTEDRTIEPETNYAVARVRQSSNDGQTDFGAMLTGVNRNLDSNTSDYLRRAAYTGGLDFRKRLFDKKYEVTANLSGSSIYGTPTAIASTQLDGVHRYQRPDDNIQFDPTRTSLTGDAERLTVSKFGGGITRFQSVLQRYSPGFESNDLGFQSRADEAMFRNWFSLQFNEPSKLFTRAFLNFNSMQKWTTEGLPTTIGLNFNWHLQFKNWMWGHLGGNLNDFTNVYADREARGGPALRKSKEYEGWTGLESDSRKAWYVNTFVGGWRGDAGNSHGWWLNPSGNFRLSSRFSASASFNYSHDLNDKQWRANFGDAGNDTTHYTFARLDQKTLDLTTRLNFTMTPNLSLQFYGEPFASSGEYTNWRELNNPRAATYADRFKPFTSQGDPGGFSFKQFRSNTVLRWEYKPGSTVFLVWAQGRDLSGDFVNDFSARRDFQDLFRQHPDNTLLLKISYWINP